MMMLAAAMTIFSKQILAELDVFNMVALRFLIAFAACFIIFIKRYRNLDRRTSLHAFILGTFLFLSYLCMVVGCKYTTASNAGFMMSLVAFFTPLIIFAQEKVRPDRAHVISIFITLTGVGLMCLSGNFTLNKGDCVCILSAFFYSFQMLYTERYAREDDPVLLGTFQLIFVSIYGFIFSLSFILQTTAEKLSTAGHTTLIYASQPVFVALFSYLMLGESISLRQVAGIVLVFIGVLITVRKDPHAQKGA